MKKFIFYILLIIISLSAFLNAEEKLENGLTFEYFGNIELLDEPRVLKVKNIDYNWTDTGPYRAAHYYSARWTGKIKVEMAGYYKFFTLSDDGVRLWVDNQLIIDNWTLHGPTEDIGALKLVKDKLYDIKLEYYQNRGDAVIQLYWQAKEEKKEIVPPSAFYHSNKKNPDVVQRFAYREITVTALDIDNNPLSGAEIYGYCLDIPLVFPGKLPFDYRHIIWEKWRLGNTDENGIIKGIVPKGMWSFFALKGGITVTACYNEFSALAEDSNILLKPDISRELDLQDNKNSLLHSTILIKPSRLPIYIAADISKTKKIKIYTNKYSNLDIWSISNSDNNWFIINWQNINPGINLKQIDIKGLASIICRLQ